MLGFDFSTISLSFIQDIRGDQKGHDFPPFPLWKGLPVRPARPRCVCLVLFPLANSGWQGAGRQAECTKMRVTTLNLLRGRQHPAFNKCDCPADDSRAGNLNLSSDGRSEYVGGAVLTLCEADRNWI